MARCAGSADGIWRPPRYLIKDATATFLDPDFQIQEATQFAGRIFKRVMYFTCEDPDAYLPVVTNLLEGFEARSQDDLAWVEASAQSLIDAGQREHAQALLTHYATTRALEALELGRTAADALEAHMRLTGGLRRAEGDQMNSAGGETVNCLADADPDLPVEQQ